MKNEKWGTQMLYAYCTECDWKSKNCQHMGELNEQLKEEGGRIGFFSFAPGSKCPKCSKDSLKVK